jgi:hypothetical protein
MHLDRLTQARSALYAVLRREYSPLMTDYQILPMPSMTKEL